MIAGPGRGLIGPVVAGRLARGVAGWPARRVGLAAVAGGLLVLAAVLGYAGPLLAQDGVGIQFGDLSSYPTETTVDGFDVQLSNLSAAATYQVVVSSDHAAAVGVGACGTATRTRSVTGATARDLRFLVYACAVAPVTLTAEVREAGAATAAASVSRALTVLAFPVGAPAGVRGVRTMTRGGDARGHARHRAQSQVRQHHAQFRPGALGRPAQQRRAVADGIRRAALEEGHDPAAVEPGGQHRGDA